MGNDNWYGKTDYQQILNELKSLKPGDVAAKASTWDGIANEINAANTEMKNLNTKLGQDDFWTGAFADSAKEAIGKHEQKVGLDGQGNSLATVTKHVADILRGDAGTLQASVDVANSNSPAPDKQKSPDDYAKKLHLLQGYAQGTYTNRLSGEQRKFESAYNPETGTGTPNPVINNNGDGGGGGQNGGGGSQNPSSSNNLANSLADKNTKPAFSDGSGSQSGQGQGAGSGGGSGAGGGSPQSGSGGSGSGLGNALSGLAGGLGKDGSGLAPGNTTAAGFGSPSGSGSGSGTGTLGGPGALRGGAGVPGPGGAGTNAAGIGGAGVRGGAMGMGGMGMAPMGGAHGRGGKGEDDDEHQTPEFLINWDNGNELFGDLPKASPGVIGDWSEHERAEKQRRESEKRRYKSMGWNVDFGDDD